MACDQQHPPSEHMIAHSQSGTSPPGEVGVAHTDTAVFGWTGEILGVPWCIYCGDRGGTSAFVRLYFLPAVPHAGRPEHETNVKAAGFVVEYFSRRFKLFLAAVCSPNSC